MLGVEHVTAVFGGHIEHQPCHQVTGRYRPFATYHDEDRPTFGVELIVAVISLWELRLNFYLYRIKKKTYHYEGPVISRIEMIDALCYCR